MGVMYTAPLSNCIPLHRGSYRSRSLANQPVDQSAETAARHLIMIGYVVSSAKYYIWFGQRSYIGYIESLVPRRFVHVVCYPDSSGSINT